MHKGANSLLHGQSKAVLSLQHDSSSATFDAVVELDVKVVPFPRQVFLCTGFEKYFGTLPGQDHGGDYRIWASCNSQCLSNIKPGRGKDLKIIKLKVLCIFVQVSRYQSVHIRLNSISAKSMRSQRRTQCAIRI